MRNSDGQHANHRAECNAFAVANFPAGAASKTLARPGAKQQTTGTDLGHWRNRWQVPAKHAHLARQQGALPLGDGTWLGYMKFPTSELAERHAQKYVAYNLLNFGIRYLGPEFFPDY
jgi:hypothetical protein